ncbi:MAG: ABC transporter permease [Clostridia bacterium]|nr:ABC transporter permease [Clostridia bacterium]
MLLGSIITVSILSSISIFSDGMLQRMLTRDLEISQQTFGKYPGGYLISYSNAYPTEGGKNSKFYSYEKKVSEVIAKSIDLPVVTQCNFVHAASRVIIRQDVKKSISTDIGSLSDMKEHVKIVHGRMFSDKKADGAYEVIVSEEGAKDLEITLGNTYSLPNAAFYKPGGKVFKIKVVGIFTYKTANDPYWFEGIEKYNKTIFMDPNLLKETLIKEEVFNIYAAKWFLAYDYHKIKLTNMSSIMNAFDAHTRWFDKNSTYLKYDAPVMPVIKKYLEREKQLKTTLLVLQVPILIMLAFYLFMVSKLKIDFESNEIAVIKSRGGKGSLIFSIYLIESLFIGLVSLIIGPLLGFYICRIIGASNGFLEFVQRSALPLDIGPNVYIYSFAAVMLIAVSTLIPAFAASRTSIVLYKQKKARKFNTAFWRKFFIDIILLAISFYGLFVYKKQQKVIFVSGVKGTDLEMDPLLFIISVLFIFGCGLLVLRVFPYIIRFIFWVGRKIWSPVFYASFIQVGRTSGQEQFTMIFIILTLSIGIFSANSARTINKNVEEKVRYEVGADIVVKGHWTSTNPTASVVSSPFGGSRSSSAQGTEEPIYFEPPYEPFTKIEGAESVTKVFKEEKASASFGNEQLTNVSLMGIIPNEFGKTAWFRNGLLPHHWYNYLNLMSDSPAAILVSKAFKDKLKAKEGDTVIINWGKQSSISGVIYAFVDYWPTLNPNRKVEDIVSPYFVVANLNYIHSMLPVEPYEVWIKKKPDTTSNQIYSSMASQKLELDSRKDTSEQLIKRKNDPMLQGTNGSLTLGFIVTIIISIIGFLIYWVMSIKKRVLQFGIFRAMGLTSNKIIGMLSCEQFLITGTSVLAGVFIGSLSSKIFVPLLQLVYGSEEQVPPFRIISYMSDYVRMYIIVGIMLVTCFIILWRIIAKINIGQALKLGED